jgi:HEAT repeat protein
MKSSNSLLLASLPAVLALGAVCILLPSRAGSRAPDLRVEPGSGAVRLAPSPQDARRVAVEIETAGSRSAGFYSLPQGRSFEMHFSSSFATDLLEAGSENGTRIELALEGKMSVLVLQATEQELVLRSSLDLTRVDASASGGHLPADAGQALAQELSRSTLVRMDRSGRILGYHFDPAARPENRNLVRTLWYAMRHSIAREDGKWLEDEGDSTGTCLVEYEWVGGTGGGTGERRITKTKLAYQELALAPRILSSRGEGRMSLALCWPLDGRYAERVELPLDGAGTSVRVEADLAFELVGDGLVERASLPRLDPAIEWESAGGDRDAGPASPSGLPSSLAMVADTTTLEQLLRAIESQLAAGLLESSELYDSQRILAELIRRDPAGLERLRSFLPGLSSTASMVVLAAVGLAQTAESQAFLAGLLRDPAELDDLRVFANLSTHQVERPTPALIDALASVIQGPESPRNVRSSALLALGNLAGRAEPEPREASLALLLAAPENDASSDDLVVWLEALGNSGSARILPAVADFLDHGDERVRESAVSALRFLAASEATELLIAALRDPSARVRTVAAEELAAQDSPAAGRAVARFLAGESSTIARKRAVAALGRSTRLDEDARGLLLQVARADPDAGVRELARAILARG